MMRGAEEGRDGARGGGRGGHVALKRHSRRREARRFLREWTGEWRRMNGRFAACWAGRGDGAGAQDPTGSKAKQVTVRRMRFGLASDEANEWLRSRSQSVTLKGERL